LDNWQCNAADFLVLVEAAVVNGRPVFRLSAFPETAGLPGPLPLELFMTGVPESGPKYRRDTELRVLTYEGFGPLVGFGLSGPFHRIAIDPASGTVVDVLAKERAPGNVNIQRVSQPPPSFVNSSLEAFVECIRVAIARFPYYSRDAELEERDEVAKDLVRLLQPVDPPALEPDHFWSTFADDVAIGDFSTEDILEMGR
jgi:hypothetical protein